jgi:hypothetical protein
VPDPAQPIFQSIIDMMIDDSMIRAWHLDKVSTCSSGRMCLKPCSLKCLGVSSMGVCSSRRLRKNNCSNFKIRSVRPAELKCLHQGHVSCIMEEKRARQIPNLCDLQLEELEHVQEAAQWSELSSTVHLRKGMDYVSQQCNKNTGFPKSLGHNIHYYAYVTGY